jgi:uncharacterized protein YbjT (DUF2867 family)
MKILVVGANGQLGAAASRQLVAEGHEVRGLVRKRERAAGLGLGGVELVEADLAASPDLGGLLAGIDVAVLTANSAAPRRGDDPARFAEGMRRLVDAAARSGVERLVLPSLPLSDVDATVPLAAERRRLEMQCQTAVPGSVVLRLPPFMECWLALAGSSIPLRGERNATIGRPSPFLRAFRRATATMVERRGVLLVPGPPSRKQAFIAVPDVAAAVAAACSDDELAGQTREVAGPEVLTWTDVAGIFARVLDRRVRVVSTPAQVYGAAAALLAPVASVPSRTMALNRFVATSETDWGTPGGGLVDPDGMTTVEQFLTEKLDLPAALPDIV